MSLILTFRNISGLAPVSDYHVRVLVGDGGPQSQVLLDTYVTEHERALGWPALVQRLLDEHTEETHV